ncbi:MULTISPECIES: hypothetical protein [Vibrio]|jgi:hypothetical protein|uniref:hypothetical protein n=1 Tax=Vibrio TaxID=662 RepID=UPI000BFFA8DD|nr:MULTISPECIES: hypothetical protein [unclassified Vibrio]PHJ40960.1 hypothetical protein AK965_14240 [Vibrio sp. PID17_43]RIZ55929.1 hypothetical protein AK966_05005 [Vibrio sp. PID23_8]
MGEKTKIPIITDTVMVDGHYQEERRSREDRRKIRKKWTGYERRVAADPRLQARKSIYEEV